MRTLDEQQALERRSRIAWLLRLSKLDQTATETARQIGMSRASYHRTCKFYGVPTSRKSSALKIIQESHPTEQLTSDQREDYKTLCANGYTAAEALETVLRPRVKVGAAS